MVPEGWLQGHVQDFFFLQRGFDLTQKQATKGNVPVYSSSGLAYFHNEAKVKAPGIVTGRKGSVGPVFLIEEDFWPHDTTLWVKDFKGNYIKYVKYFMDFLRLKRFDEASSVPTLNRNNVHGVKCVFPPLSEQKKIAKILSTWDRAIEVTEKLLSNSQQQKESFMQQLLTGKKRFPGFNGEWKNTNLSKISSVIMGSSPKSEAYNDKNKGLPLLQGNADIKNRLSSPRIFTSQITKECMIGDVLLSVRAPVGEISRSIHHACIGRGIAAIQAKSGVCQDFIYQWFLYFEPKWERLSQGSTFESVNSNDIKSLHMEIPSFEEQQKIASVLSAADKEIEVLQQKLECLKQEKKSTDATTPHRQTSGESG